MMTLGAWIVAAAVLGVDEGMVADRADAVVVVDDFAQLAGEWKVIEFREKHAAAMIAPTDIRIVFEDGRMNVTLMKQPAEEYQVRLNPRATPKQIDMTRKSGTEKVTGVYEQRQGKLYLYYRSDGVRPKNLELPREGGMMILERVEKKK